MALTKEQILKAEDSRQEVVEVPEWGGSVIIKSMTAVERDKFEMETNQDGGRNLANFRARIAAACLYGDDGKLLFTNHAEVEALGKKNGAVMTRILEACQRINGSTEEAVETLEGN